MRYEEGPDLSVSKGKFLPAGKKDIKKRKISSPRKRVGKCCDKEK